MTAPRDKSGRPIVVVTGMGVVTSLGAGQADNWAKLTAGESGIRTITRFPIEGLKTTMADLRPKDGQIELSEWLDYAVARVPLMQARTAADAQGRILEQEEDAKKKPRDIQRPRVFYRTGLEARQLIIAKP